MKRLELSFYQRNSVLLAQKLLGKYLIRNIGGDRIMTKIVETEAYMGPEDKAAHSYNNRRTQRTEVMFGRPGKAYVYMIYGMYYCLNIVAGEEEIPEAVLIRGVEPIEGIEILKQNRKIKGKQINNLTNGPGKLCEALAIDKSLNGSDLVFGNEIYILDSKEKPDIVKSKRINIDYAEEYVNKLWRFYIRDNIFVSRP
ncbi:MAG TPA: DNA-3-methyladenine glycosylase [Eubacteriaceae bacterium]|nr:DNA-3-methyladenine glycosylase [Eubacteriaceae bacterium]